MKNITSILLVIGILLLANFISKRYFFRLDLTEDKQYTLSGASDDILANLAETGNPVTVTAYFSENLPPYVAKTRSDFQDLLVEYANKSKGYLNFEFISPKTEEEKQEALQNGIQPVMINVREKDQMKQQQAFMGAVLKMGETQEIMPVIQPGTAMEYALSTNIKKMSVIDKPSIGLLQGHGEPGLQELSQAYEQLSILYSVENIDLNTEESIPVRFKTVAIINPKDSFPTAHFSKLDDYLGRGGNLFVALNAVEGDFQTQQGTAKTVGLESWLSEKGVLIENSFVVDGRCGTVSVQQKQGFFTMNTPVQFPFLPMISKFTDHPITKGLEQVMFPFASPVKASGKAGLTFTSLALSSEKSGIINPPTFFDVTNKQWTQGDLPMSGIAVAGVLEGNIVGDNFSRIVAIGDGDFCISGQRGQNPDNISLMTNSIDWLSDDTGLIELRTKGITTRPIDELEDGTRSMIKMINFLLPILLIVIYGIFRTQRNKSRRLKRMQMNFE